MIDLPINIREQLRRQAGDALVAGTDLVVNPIQLLALVDMADALSATQEQLQRAKARVTELLGQSAAVGGAVAKKSDYPSLWKWAQPLVRHGKKFVMPDLDPCISTKASRLHAMAQDAIRQYGEETAAGGEPSYPFWADDMLAVCNTVAQAPVHEGR